MKNRDAFASYHPAVNFLYFALVLLFAMCLMHPVSLGVTLAAAISYNVYLNGRKGARFSAGFLRGKSFKRLPSSWDIADSY